MNRQYEMESYICRYVETPPRTMYNIGVGPKTEWKVLTSKYTSMKLFGCEPLMDQYPQLMNFPGRLEEIAIGDGEDTEINFIPGQTISASFFPAPHLTEKRIVPTCSLDSFDKMMGQQERILLWMDIEGMELAALKSAPELLESGRIRWINLEERKPGFKPEEGWCTGVELRKLLDYYGYDKVAEYNKHRGHHDVIYRHKEEAA